MFNTAFPIISTPDLPRALVFYRDALEGKVLYQFPDEGEAVFVSLSIGAAEVGLSQDDAAGPASARFALWVYADDCDEAVERLRHAGATVTEEPADQPWGERVARVLDPDGNVVIIGSKPA